MFNNCVPGFIKLFLLLVILYLASFPGKDATAGNEAIEAEADAIEKRAYEALTSSYPGATYEAFIVYETPETGFKTEIEYSAYFDHKRLRLKKRFRHATSEKDSISTSDFSDDKGWTKPDYVIIKDDVIIIRNSEYEQGTYKDKQSMEGDFYANKQAFWPQFIGTALAPVWRMPQLSPRGFLNREDHTATKITEEDYNQLKTIRVDYTVQGKGNFSIWYCPAQNGLMVKIEGRTKTNTRLLETHVEIINKQWAPSIWFPKQIKYSWGSKGHEIEKETTEIQSFEVVEPNDEEFGYKGVELPIGAPIQDLTVASSEQLQIWTKDGARLMTKEEEAVGFPVAKESLPKKLENVKDKSGSRFTALIVLNLVVIAIVAVLFLFLRKRT
ncbi:hypothetical protein [Gimesia aquarii]|uniref:Uncharacterized protein n=1 Tax=Gimesia aquarii TaxID=2527964 RepID=A0A517WTY6_9PLAN|nr:hypothetical protein [Gimesia aquarii]QDU08735.1 hypothetical protein V202x_21050 [Gimesia aquarii]